MCGLCVVGSRLGSGDFLQVLRFSCLRKNQHFKIPIRAENSRSNNMNKVSNADTT